MAWFLFVCRTHLQPALGILILSEHRQRKTETANFATSGAGAGAWGGASPAVWVPPFQSQSVNLDTLEMGIVESTGSHYKFQSEKEKNKENYVFDVFLVEFNLYLTNNCS